MIHKPQTSDSPADQDTALAMLAAAGDQNAFAILYDRYLPPLYRYCYWQVNDEQLAEDLAATAFIEIAKTIKTFKGTGSFKNWAYTITKRQIAAHLRQKYRLRTTELIDNLVGDVDVWIDEDNGKVKEKVVALLLEHVSDTARQVLELRFLKNYSVAETAAALGLTEDNVKVLTHRALKELRKFAYPVVEPQGKV